MTEIVPPSAIDVATNGVVRPRPRGYDVYPRNVLPLIAFDPGQMTGWSLIILKRHIGERDTFHTNFEMALNSRRKWEHGQIECLDEDLGVCNMMRLCEAHPTAAIVVEDFILRPDRNERSRNLLSPVRITAKLEHYLWRVQRRMITQQASMAMTTATDDRLRNWGCYVPGMPHARDADRHLLTFIRRCFGNSGIQARRLAWPFAYDHETVGG